MLELSSPEGAFERIEEYLRERGFFGPGGEGLEADVYLGYGLSEPLRRGSAPPPPEPCPLPLAAVRARGGEVLHEIRLVDVTALDRLADGHDRVGVVLRGPRPLPLPDLQVTLCY
ncbi:MAG: hypothetical protein H0T13_08565, partial [Actinobacteria bacterium]|nr:hypothetical protein [Actinomycetota bacterium]